jgi:vacuolar protein sorting-associated protein 13A/C
MLKEIFIQHYKSAMIKQIYKIVGSIDILGNPLRLVKNIGQGVFDFIDKPIEGFV